MTVCMSHHLYVCVYVGVYVCVCCSSLRWWYAPLCMCVCMCVCVSLLPLLSAPYAAIPVCVYVCVYVSVACHSGGSMLSTPYAATPVCMYVCIYVCMSVYMSLRWGYALHSVRCNTSGSAQLSEPRCITVQQPPSSGGGGQPCTD